MGPEINLRHKIKIDNGFSKGYINGFVPQPPLTKTIINFKKCLRDDFSRNFVALDKYWKITDRVYFTLLAESSGTFSSRRYNNSGLCGEPDNLQVSI